MKKIIFPKKKIFINMSESNDNLNLQLSPSEKNQKILNSQSSLNSKTIYSPQNLSSNIKKQTLPSNLSSTSLTSMFYFSKEKRINLINFHHSLKEIKDQKDKLICLRTLLKEKLRVLDNSLPIISSGKAFSVSPCSKNKEFEEINDIFRDDNAKNINLIHFYQRNKIGPRYIKTDKFKAGIHKRFIVLSKQKFAN